MADRKTNRTAERDPRNPAPTKAAKSKSNSSRPARKPLTRSSKLGIPPGVQRDGYAYRWIKDNPQRVSEFEQAWWTVVKDGEGKACRVSAGSGEYLILVEQEEKYFEEDRQLNRKRTIDLIGESAKLKKDSGGNTVEYVPEGHESVVSIKH